MSRSSIEWTEMTWNPSTGCNKISSGCKFCYAEVMAKRLKAMGQKKYSKGFELKIHESALRIPYTWKSPKIVFVNSMSDLFHKDIPLNFIKKVFEVMNDNPQHVFQILTKRADRLLSLDSELKWSHNIWMGVSVENEEVLDRIDSLKLTNARIKFLSCEPLISPLPNLSLDGIDWVIVGGESGPKARPMEPQWVIEIQNRCAVLNVPFFFKQWGGKNKKRNGYELNGKVFHEMPEMNY